MNAETIVYICLLFVPYLLFAINSHAQLGAPVYNQDFGLGDEYPNTIGAALPASHSSFAFSNSLCPPPGGCLAATTGTLRVVNKNAVKTVIDGTENICRYYDSAVFKSNSGDTLKSWKWNFGNGQTSTLANPPVQYFSTTGNENSFTVQLAIKDTSGCTDTAYHVLKLANNCFIAVPSAYTPNGDGSNDYLYPLNAYKASHLICRIYNRNGQLVFAGKDRSQKWDGTLGGNPQPEGAYVRMLEYTDAGGKKVSFRGTSVLIR